MNRGWSKGLRLARIVGLLLHDLMSKPELDRRVQ